MEAIATIRCHWDNEIQSECFVKQLHLPADIEDERDLVKSLSAEIEKRSPTLCTISGQLDFSYDRVDHQLVLTRYECGTEWARHWLQEFIDKFLVELSLIDVFNRMTITLLGNPEDE